MDTCDPQSLASALASMFHYAAKQVRQAPNPVLHSIFDQLPGLTAQSSALPDGALGNLQQTYDSPNWSSLLVSVMLKIQKPLEPSIWIGAAQPAGWSRMLTLNYSPDARLGAPPTPPVVTIGLAVTDPGKTQGIWVSVAGEFYHAIPYPPKRRLTASLSATATATPTGTAAGPWTWEFPFDGQPTNAAPAGVSAEASVSWAPGWSGQATPVYALTLGGLSASMQLGSVDPTYQVQVGLGPLGGTLTPRAALGDGLASRLPKLGNISVHYSPSLVVEQGAPPSFSLGS